MSDLNKLGPALDALETISDAFFILDADWRFSFVNAEAVRIFDKARDELLGANIWELFPFGVDTEFYTKYHAARDTQTVQVIDYQMRNGNWVQAKAFPFANGICVLVMDTTEQVMARQRLQKSEEKFRLVAEVSSDCVWDWDPAADRVEWGGSTERLFHVTNAFMAPNFATWAERLHPEDRERVTAGFQAFMAGQASTWRDEYRFKRGDGEYAIVSDRAIAVRDEAGRPVRVIGSLEDVSALRAAQTQIREQAELLDIAGEAIFVIDVKNRVRFWNRSCDRLLGWSRAEVEGKDVEELIYADPDQSRSAVQAVLKSGGWSGELIHRSRSGVRVIVEARWTLLKDPKCTPQSILCIHSDVTEKKRMEAHFQRAQRLEAIGTLAGGIAHDLNNILAPVALGLELLSEDLKPERRQQLLKRMHGSLERGRDVIKQLLTFARGAEGERAPVEMDVVFREIVALVSETFPRNLRFHHDLRARALKVEGDATQLHQVLLNLFVNARDAMPSGGDLKLVSRQVQIDPAAWDAHLTPGPRPFLKITVADTGPGIPEEIRDKIFEPFFTTKEIGKGSGLGLSMSLAIIRRHGGFIHVSSSPGQGTVFDVYLPVCDSPMPEARTRADDAVINGAGRTILVVDDEQDLRETISEALDRVGFSVLTAAHGFEALELLRARNGQVNLVLTDINMPVMDGVELIRQLDCEFPTIPILVVSGHWLSSEKKPWRDRGAPVHFLEKPFTNTSLLGAIRGTFSQ